MALIIGLTGGIASGKSTVANMLKNEESQLLMQMWNRDSLWKKVKKPMNIL